MAVKAEQPLARPRAGSLALPQLGQWTLPLGLAAVLAIVTTIPYLYAWTSQPAGHVFMGFFFLGDDANTYLAKMREGWEGSWIWTNRYSTEPGTVSALLPHRVDPDVAAERQQALMELQRRISRERHEAMVGRELDVLVEGTSSESDYLMEGRWYGQAPGIDGVTYLTDGRVPPGSLVRARITQASDYDLAASLET